MRYPHSSAPRGKLIRVTLRDGTVFEDRFKEKTGKFVVFDNHRVPRGDLQGFTIVRGERAL